jgi:peptide/nickel transport system substrate-binding protein
MGQVYEPLMFVNTLQSGKTTPWLATASAWGSNNTTLTFTIRNGVKWNDGTPMSAADVAFTFNLMKKFPTLDLNSVWSVLSGVTQQGDKVVMTFKNAAVPYYYYIADQTPIVPQQIWSKIANPVTYADSNPVGTGAFMVKPCSPQNITYLANPNYWQPGEPKIAKVLSRRLPPTTPPTPTSPPARRSGAASSSRTSTPSTRPRARTTTTGSRRSRT